MIFLPDAYRGVLEWVRQAAAKAFLAISKPADPGSESRRLLWEQPDTDRERRAAAALLGWVPDTRSITPILVVLAGNPDRLRRNQLLVHLNMILLQEGAPADVELRKTLAAEHHRGVPGSRRRAVLGSTVHAIVGHGTRRVSP